jgi:hypothetical protein
MSPTSVQGLDEAQSRQREITERWAVVFKHTDRSGISPVTREEVISVETREPNSGPPSLAGLRSSPHREAYSVERVPPGVRIGMVRGGELNECAGFGWPDEFTRDSAGYSTDERRLPAGRRNAKRRAG